jgi:glycosyltransferase involved in cell wall biosynthesis
MTIKISAAITTYNRSNELRYSISSIVNQTSHVDEILVIDDGSSDNTKDVISALSKEYDREIRYIYQNNKGASAARNTAFRESRYNFIAFLDDDDIWLRNHIELFRTHYNNIPNMVVYAGYIAKEAAPKTPMRPKDERLFLDYENNPMQPGLIVKCQAPLRRPFYTPSFSTAIISKTHALNNPLNEQLKAREDIAFFWLLSEKGTIAIHQQIHAIARQLDVSLLSLPETASLDKKLGLEHSRAYWSRKMLGYILKDRSRKECPILFRMYGESLLGEAHYSFLLCNDRSAIKLLVKSTKHIVTINQFKLLLRLLLRIKRTM